MPGFMASDQIFSPRWRIALLAALLAAFPPALLAVTPQFWENFTQEDLLSGTLTRVSLSSDGRLHLAPEYAMVYDTTQPYIFSMVRDKAGNVYLGTGHEGKVYRIDPQGKGSLYFESKELDIFALGLDAADTLYVGTSPDGKVYKVTGPNQATEFCNPEDKYVWALLFDAQGNLYVGTGGRGLVLKVDRSGKKSTFLDSDDSHVVSLARGNNGNLLAGTSPGGMVIEINPQGKAFTLLDTTMEEVRSMAVDRFGTIIAVASSSKGLPSLPSTSKPAGGAPTTGAPLPIVTIQALSVVGDKSRDTAGSVTAPGGEKDAAGSRSSIYAITRDGSVETVYSSRDHMVYDAIVRDDGSILAATGGHGRLLSIDSAKQVSVVTDSPEEQITRLFEDGGSTLAAGSNQGRLYRLAAQRAASGTFESKLLDAKTVASWGRIAWRIAGNSGGAIEVSSRSGNTEKPDTTWSDWSAAYSNPEGQAITSPRARYLQWRATFKRGSAAAYDLLERVQIAYLQQNLRPQVVSISLLPYGVGLQKTPSVQTGTVNISTSSGTTDGHSFNSPRDRGRDRQPLSPRQVVQPGAQSFTWKATDDNQDDLVYSIYFRGEGESDWKLLEREVSDTFYTLDSASLPDGVYTLKVVASDADSNPYGKFLIGEMVSKPFVISNSTPSLELLGHKMQGKRVEAQFRVKVPTGRVATAEFSIDGGEWHLVFPEDGIADAAQEQFQLLTADLATGEHIIGLRASDANGNTGTSKIVVRIP
jgi:hypothetical protein